MSGQQLQTPINLAAVELPNSGSYFTEDGMYKCIIEKAELKAAKSNNANVMLALTLRCIEGVHKDARTVHNVNLYNQNVTAVKIAMSELAAYVTAMGADPMLQNTSQLLGKPFHVYVKVEQVQDKVDANKSYTNNSFSDWAYADGTPIVRGQFGAGGAGAQANGGYAAPNAAPVAPVAPQPVTAPAQPQYQQPQQVQQPQVQQPQAQYQAPAAEVQYQQPAATTPQPQYQQPAPTTAQQQPTFAPPAGTAPFAPPQA